MTCPLCTRSLNGCQCGTTPAGATPAHAIVKRGFYMCCTLCGLAVEYCVCGSRPARPSLSDDAAERDLERRIKECKGK